MRWISGFIISLLLLFAGGYSPSSASMPHNSLVNVVELAAKHTVTKSQLKNSGPVADFHKRYVSRPKYKMAISSDDDDEDDQVEAKKSAQAVSLSTPIFYSSYSAHDAYCKTVTSEEHTAHCISAPIYLRYRSIRV